MADRIDPMGKRALFWVAGPAERTDDEADTRENVAALTAAVRRSAVRTVRTVRQSRAGGASAPAAEGRDRGTQPPGPRRPRTAELGRRALFSSAAPAEGPAGTAAGRRRPRQPAEPAAEPIGSAAVGEPTGNDHLAAASPTPRSVVLHCATCGARSTVGLLQFARLHLPLFVWRPGRGFTRFMTCPACRRRAWVSASWPGVSTGLLRARR